jgi:hypothetical protein
VWEKSMPKLSDIMGGEPKQRFIVKALYTGEASLWCYGLKLGLTKVGNQAKPLKYSEKIKYFKTIQSRCSNAWPQPGYTADDAAETDVCAKKCQVAAASRIWAIRSSSESAGEM